MELLSIEKYNCNQRAEVTEQPIMFDMSLNGCKPSLQARKQERTKKNKEIKHCI